jgi:hypothetical protein
MIRKPEGWMGEAVIPRGHIASRYGFYPWMSVLCAAMAFLGFMPTFFVPLVAGAFARAPIFYVHVLLFYAWTIYFMVQTWLVSSGRQVAHRDWGILGAALCTAMVFSVMSIVVAQLNQSPPILEGPGSASFAWVQVFGMGYFLSCVAVALGNTRRPEVHKRLMLLATLSLLDAPIARLGVLFLPTDRPPSSLLEAQWFSFVVLGLMLIPMVYDLRTRGRVSRVYLVGVPVYLVEHLTWPLVWSTPAWLAVANAIRHLGQ